MSVLLAAVPIASALGHDVPSCALDLRGAPAALAPLLEGCVHHYAVNGTDVLFFAGDADALAAHVEALARHGPVTLVPHAGRVEVRSPWDPAPRPIAADWRTSLAFDCGRRGRRCRLVAVRVDAWTGTPGDTGSR